MEILDSYLLRDGRVIGRDDHERRFSLGAREAGWDPVDIEAFMLRVRDELPRTGTYFPLIEASDGLNWQLRHPPELRQNTQLYIPSEQDQRAHPKIKGPDYAYLHNLREMARAAGADDAVLHRNGKVLEAANAAIMFFVQSQDDTPIALLPPEQAQVLDSVTARASIAHMHEAGWQVQRGVLTLAQALQTPAWVGSSLHGWTRLTHWVTDAGRRAAPMAPDPAAINTALWDAAE